MPRISVPLMPDSLEDLKRLAAIEHRPTCYEAMEAIEQHLAANRAKLRRGDAMPKPEPKPQRSR